jgi:hypothetical protein
MFPIWSSFWRSGAKGLDSGSARGGAGLGSLAVCSGAFVAIGYLFIASISFFGGWIGSSLDPTIFWFGVVAAMIFAGAGLSLPALALGARGGRALVSTLLSGLGFGAFVFFFLASLDYRYGFGAGAASLMALVGVSVVSPLVAVQEEEDHVVAVRLGRATVIAAVAICCASVLAYWSIFGTADPGVFFLPYAVAAASWPVLPAIAAMLRSD